MGGSPVRGARVGSPAWALAAALSLAAATGAAAGEGIVGGWIERARVGELLVVEAKLDTGADTCSLGVERLLEFRRSGRRWVRFWVEDPSEDGRRIRYERRLVRWARIERHGPDDRRPVVGLDLCVGSVARRVEVNLVDRSGFDYPLLVGRNFLAGAFVIDPDAQHLLGLDCPGEAGREEGEREEEGR